MELNDLKDLLNGKTDEEIYDFLLGDEIEYIGDRGRTLGKFPVVTIKFRDGRSLTAYINDFSDSAQIALEKILDLRGKNEKIIDGYK